jgi:hypothetical protein
LKEIGWGAGIQKKLGTIERMSVPKHFKVSSTFAASLKMASRCQVVLDPT